MKVNIWIREDLLENFERGLNIIYHEMDNNLTPNELIAIRWPHFTQNPDTRIEGYIQISISADEYIALKRYEDELVYD